MGSFLWIGVLSLSAGNRRDQCGTALRFWLALLKDFTVGEKHIQIPVRCFGFLSSGDGSDCVPSLFRHHGDRSSQATFQSSAGSRPRISPSSSVTFRPSLLYSV